MLFTLEPIKNWYAAATLDIASLIASGAITDSYFTNYANLTRVVVKLASTEGSQEILVSFPVADNYNGGAPLSGSVFIDRQAHDNFVLSYIILSDAHEQMMTLHPSQVTTFSDFNVTFTSTAAVSNAPEGTEGGSIPVVTPGLYTQVMVNSVGQVIAGYNPANASADALAAEEQARMAAVSAEEQARMAADSTEEAARIAADQALTSVLLAEAATRASDYSNLQTALNTETSARQAADTSLSSSLSDESLARQSADSTESLARQSADATEQSARIAADNQLSADLATEQSARIAADSTLTNDLATEQSARVAADSQLTSSLATEQSARTAADATLTSNLAAEQSARTAADALLQTSLDDESLARQSADSTESLARQSADATLASNLAAEQSARTAADASTLNFAKAYTDSKISNFYDAIVGSAAQVTAGIATHSSIAAALSAITAGQSVLILPGTYTENLTINKACMLEGKGNSTVISGTVAFSASYCNFEKLRVTGNMTINSGANNNNLSVFWLASNATVTDNGTSNYILAIQD